MFNLKYKLCVTFLVLTSTLAVAAKPTCTSAHGGYCSYRGTVANIYVNAGDTILIYFEEAIPLSETGVAGFTITKGSAAAFKISDNPDFAKMFYSTALAAQASGRAVSLQMKDVESGYLKFDRIWLAK
jgi:hypothetical protein